MNTEKSWKERSDAVIAQGCTTYSKRYDQFVEGVYPTHAKLSTTDCKIVDYDGNEYIDFGGLGAGLWADHNTCSLPWIQEVELAEKIKERVPCIEKLKILKTGSAACEMAVRFARAFSGKSLILFSGYHGTHDTFIAHEIPGAGCVGKGNSYKFSTIKELIEGFPEVIQHWAVAAAIIEPVILDNSEEHIQDLHALRKLCTKHNALLIFDEIVTGWRYPDYTVATHHGIKPDLICLGKGLGNGHPLAILGGRADIMDNPGVFCSNTHNGELSSIEEALALIAQVDNAKILSAWAKGSDCMERFNSAAKELGLEIRLVGIPTRWAWEGNETLIAILWQEMLYKGYLLGKSMFPRMSWGLKVYDEFATNAEKCLKDIAKGKVVLKGKLPRPVFKRY